MFLGIANAISGIKSGGLSFIKDNLKLYLDFKSSRSDTLAFSSEGSTLFDGVNDRIDVSATLSSGTYTVMGWVYKTLQDGSYFVDFRKDSGTGYFAFSNNSNNSIYAQSGTLYVNGVAGTTVPLNTWTHICVNGMTIESSTTKIGCQNNDTNFFKGSMTNVALWNRELSIEEINSVMNKSYSQLGSVEKTSLVSWWALDSASNGVVQPATGETLGSNTFVSLDNFVTKSGGQVSVANNEVTLTIPTGGDSGMQIGNLAGFGISSSLGYADNDLAKISFEAKVVTNASGFGNTVRFKDNQGNVITNTDITLTTEYQTFTNYYVLTTVSGYRIPLLYRNGNRTGEDVQKFRNFSIEKVTSNTGFITGATTTTSVYGGNAPILPRAIDIAESFAEQIGDGSALFNGSSDYIDLGADVYDFSSGDFTLTAWVYHDTSHNAHSGIFGIRDSTNTEVQFYINSSNNTLASWNGSGNVNSTSAIADEVWTHVGLIQSGSNKKFYINGVLDNTASQTNGTARPATLKIGFTGHSNEYLLGNVSQAGIWAGELSQEKIQSLMESTSYAKIPASVKSTLGSEKVSEPSFASSTGWATDYFGTGWSIAENKLVSDGTQSAGSNASADITTSAGLYKVTITVDSLSSGTLRPNFETWGSYISTTGTHIQYFKLTGNNDLTIQASADFVGSISFVSVKEVTNDLVAYYPLDADSSANGVTNNVTTGEVLGSEIMADGNFDSGISDFTNNDTGWVYRDNALGVIDGSATTGIFARANKSSGTIVAGALYKVQFTVVEESGGNLRVRVGAGSFTYIYDSGTYIKYIIAGSSTVEALNFYAEGNWQGYIDNISVKEVTSNTGVLK